MKVRMMKVLNMKVIMIKESVEGIFVRVREIMHKRESTLIL